MDGGMDINNDDLIIEEFDESSDIQTEPGEDIGADIAQDEGVDLNGEYDDAGGDAAPAEPYDEGEDLNDSGMDAALDNFGADRWNDLSLDEQKQSMTDLAASVAADTGNEYPPEVVFRDDMDDGTYGGYNPETNMIEINENMLGDSAEAADTIAHEMWHAYQYQAANDPNNPRSSEYRDGFDNYISYEYDFEGYENQMVEAEAREYAQGIKNRLGGKS